MKKYWRTSFFLFVFVCFATEAHSDFIIHNNCQVNIYHNFSKGVIDFNDNNARYDTNTVIGIENLLISKGYHPVASYYVDMSLDISSKFYKKELGEFVDMGPADYACWDLSVTMTNKKGTNVFKNSYETCRNMNMIADVLGDGVLNKNFGDTIYFDAFSYHMPEALHAVLLGATSEQQDDYNHIPKNIAIVNSIPYCCTPQNITKNCL